MIWLAWQRIAPITGCKAVIDSFDPRSGTVRAAARTAGASNRVVFGSFGAVGFAAEIDGDESDSRPA
ncbi:MAG: hypothetical protein GY725_19900 [bacterium]|nr:hypothetical protein [bacterium]